MYPEHMKRGCLWLSLGLSLAACDGDKPAPAPSPQPAPEVVEEAAVPSSRPRVQFKGGQRYATDLSEGLGLARLELCQELGRYDCVDQVHDITLGGVEPYKLRINKPLPVAPVTAPIAVDRVALSACDQRAERDFAAPEEAVIFGEVASGAPDEAKYAAVSARLYERLLQREAEPAEVAALAGFVREVEEEVGAEAAPREWATMSCFVVATSMEALFY